MYHCACGRQARCRTIAVCADWRPSLRRASTTARRAQVALLFAALCARPAPAAGGADAHLPDAAAVERFTGSHTRLDWVRDGRLAQFDTRRPGRGAARFGLHGPRGKPVS
jgi:hypothetical protein